MSNRLDVNKKYSKKDLTEWLFSKYRIKKKINKFNAVEIMTGAIIPNGFDTIIPIEQIIFFPNKENAKYILVNKIELNTTWLIQIQKIKGSTARTKILDRQRKSQKSRFSVFHRRPDTGDRTPGTVTTKNPAMW